jgi:hypothetical protein
MPRLNTVEQLRDVNWGRSYLWELFFIPAKDKPAPSHPFDYWFPASEVEEQLHNPEAHPFEVGQQTLSIPHRMGERTITITFYDNVEGIMENWLNDWLNSIHNKGEYVTVLQTAIRELSIRKLDLQKNLIQVNSYYVYPNGALTFSGNSSSEARTYSMEFVVAGINDSKQITT